MTYWAQAEHLPKTNPSRSGLVRHRLSLIGISLKTSFKTLPFIFIKPKVSHFKITPQAVARLALPNYRILLVIRGLPTFPTHGYPTDRLWVLTPTHIVALWHTPISIHRRFIDRQKITNLGSKLMPDKIHLDLTLKAGPIELHLAGVPALALTALSNHFSMRRRHTPLSPEATERPDIAKPSV